MASDSDSSNRRVPSPLKKIQKPHVTIQGMTKTPVSASELGRFPISNLTLKPSYQLNFKCPSSADLIPGFISQPSRLPFYNFDIGFDYPEYLLISLKNPLVQKLRFNVSLKSDEGLIQSWDKVSFSFGKSSRELALGEDFMKNISSVSSFTIDISPYENFSDL